MLRRAALTLAVIAATATATARADERAPERPGERDLRREHEEPRKDAPVPALEKLFERWRHESAIEGRMIMADLRGRLGLNGRPPVADWTPRQAGKGRLERGPNGIPIVRLEGTPEERGEQHGRLLGREARALAETYLRSFLGDAEIERARRRARALFEDYLTQDERRELDAFSRACGVARDDLLLAQGFADLYRAWGCSTLTCGGKEPMLARNLDFVDMGFIHRYSCVFVVKPSGGTAYAAVGWPGLIGVLSGQNERGVALAVMVVHGERGCVEGVPFQLAFRRALERSKTSDDVAKVLGDMELTVTNNLAVVDREGRSRVLEIGPDGVVSREGSRLVSTNHFVSQARSEPRFSLTYLSSLRRYAAVEKVANGSEVTLPRAIEALRASGPPLTNVQSMVFLPRAGEIHVAFGRPPAARRTWTTLDRKLLFGE